VTQYAKPTHALPFTLALLSQAQLVHATPKLQFAEQPAEVQTTCFIATMTPPHPHPTVLQHCATRYSCPQEPVDTLRKVGLATMGC
jgi:hypothetical protein